MNSEVPIQIFHRIIIFKSLQNVTMITSYTLTLPLRVTQQILCISAWDQTSLSGGGSISTLVGIFQLTMVVTVSSLLSKEDGVCGVEVPTVSTDQRTL